MHDAKAKRKLTPEEKAKKRDKKAKARNEKLSRLSTAAKTIAKDFDQRKITALGRLFEEEKEAAISRKLDSHKLAQCVADLRRGKDPCAADRLADGFLWLVFETAGSVWRERGQDDLNLGEFYKALRVAIGRLAKTRKCDDPEKFIRDELNRTKREFPTEESSNLYPPASTNCDRRKAGTNEYHSMRRHGDQPVYGTIQDEVDSQCGYQSGRSVHRRGHDSENGNLHDPEMNWLNCDQSGNSLAATWREDPTIETYKKGPGAPVGGHAGGNPDSPSSRNIAINQYEVDRRLDLTDGTELDGRILHLADLKFCVAHIAAVVLVPADEVKQRINAMRSRAAVINKVETANGGRPLYHLPPKAKESYLPDDYRNDSGHYAASLMPLFAPRKSRGRVA